MSIIFGQSSCVYNTLNGINHGHIKVPKVFKNQFTKIYFGFKIIDKWRTLSRRRCVILQPHAVTGELTNISMVNKD
jgi:hypothetical protein